MNILGLTCDQVLADLRPSSQQRKPLRSAYKRLMRGELVRGPIGADVLPVVRRVHDGDLTKFIQRADDNLEIESVVVPMARADRSWKTLCISSQIGCARGCAFCETGQLGLLRNLSAAEIVGQVVAARRDYGDQIRNVVFMGMGEPFDNFDAVSQAIRVFTDQAGLSMGGERLTISTVGLVEGIRRLPELNLKRMILAVSLNAPNDEIRSQIMPVNRLVPMAELREALLAHPLRNCQFIMIEYVLIPGLNDAPEHARQLADYLKPLKCVVNLIPYNPRTDSPWKPPTRQSIIDFLEWLKGAGQMCKLRLTKGRDQMAACGQLGNRTLSRRNGDAAGS